MIYICFAFLLVLLLEGPLKVGGGQPLLRVCSVKWWLESSRGYYQREQALLARLNHNSAVIQQKEHGG